MFCNSTLILCLIIKVLFLKSFFIIPNSKIKTNTIPSPQVRFEKRISKECPYQRQAYVSTTKMARWPQTSPKHEIGLKE